MVGGLLLGLVVIVWWVLMCRPGLCVGLGVHFSNRVIFASSMWLTMDFSVCAFGGCCGLDFPLGCDFGILFARRVVGCL